MIDAMSNELKSRFLVSIQFGSLFLIILLGKLNHSFLILWVVQLFSVFLGLWAIYSMGLRNVSVSPMVKQGAILIKNGPYKLIRHPMYTAIFLFVIPLVIIDPNAFRLIFGSLLFANMMVKLHFEEKLLSTSFDGYIEYKKHTYKIIPFLF